MEYLAWVGYLGKVIQNILKKSGALALPAAALALICSGGAAGLLPAVSVAQAAPKATEAPAIGSHSDPASSGNGSAGHVTVIILDMSGSMSANDPDGLRCSAANAYIDLSGPGDFVGVVGLDGTGSGGPQDFGVAVDWGLAPREMSTIAARQALINDISQKSNQCRPDDDTPTYDALSQALAMLTSSTQGGVYSGSVILLTDGTPYPSTNAQISAIQTHLVPQFKAHDWPIDTIALGSDTSFYPFLSGISSATSGTFYDDGNGVVPGVSPLNIAPFFVAIFRLRNGRSPGPTIGPTELNGGVTARNFSVGQYVTELDVIVVKDNPATTVSILAPDGQRIPPSTAGAFVATDPHFMIVSLDTPQPGAWEIDVSGTGLFLMDSLKVSALTLSLTSPSTSGPLALGEPFTVSAQLGDQGVPISGGRFNMTGTISFVGDSATPYTEDILLAEQGGSSAYSVQVTIPTTAPTGSYQIEVGAQSATEEVITAQSVVRLDLFPSALLIGQHGATTQPVAAAVTEWDKPLQLLYSLPIASFFSGLPLDGIPAQPSAVVRGQVELNGKPYTEAKVAGTATRTGTTRQIPVTFVNDGGGAFHLIFPSDANGTYTLELTTQGAYDISHGDLTNVSRSVEVNLVPNTPAERLRAYLVTMFYLLILAFLALLFRYLQSPKPRGAIVSTPGGADEFGRARRPQAFFSPSTVESGQMGLDPGLSFRFTRGGRVWVRGTTAGDNYRQAGGKVPTTWFSAANADLSSSDGRVHYQIEAGGRRNLSGQLDTRSELAKRIIGSRPSGDRDDDYDDNGRRSGRGGLFSARRRSHNSDDEDDYNDRGSRQASSKIRNDSGRSHYSDDEDDQPRRRRSRGDDDW